MSDGWNIALLGATGAVGEALLELLQERQFPVGELYPLASERSAGANVRFNGKSLLVQNAEEFDWSQAQLAFFVAGSEASARYAEEAGNMGCLVIDTSGLFAMEPDVPLVVPGVNPQVLADYRNRNIVAVADSMVSQLLTAIKPLTEQAGLSRLHVTTLMSVSSRGKVAVDDLAGQSARLLNGIPAEEGVFGKQLAFNLLPLIADEQGSVREERLIVDQVRKVLQDEGLPISVSCVQSPVFYGHAQVVHLEALRPLSAEEARSELEEVEDIQLSEEDDYPTQVTDASGSDALSIGCLRNDYGIPELLQFWARRGQCALRRRIDGYRNRRAFGAGADVLMSEVVSPVQPTLKIALGIEYDGSRYYGWQRQQEVASVQQRLEQALSKVADAPISVLCAGRTDAGVHATGQVVHFETTARRKDAAWTMGVNTHLPPDIAVRWVSPSPTIFTRVSAPPRAATAILFSTIATGRRCCNRGDAFLSPAGRRSYASGGAGAAGRKRLHFVPRGAMSVAHPVALRKTR